MIICKHCNDTGRDGIFSCEPCKGGTITDSARIERRADRKVREDAAYIAVGRALNEEVAAHGYDDDGDDE